MILKKGKVVHEWNWQKNEARDRKLSHESEYWLKEEQDNVEDALIKIDKEIGLSPDVKGKRSVSRDKTAAKTPATEDSKLLEMSPMAEQ